MFEDEVFSIEEVSQHLRVPTEAVMTEVASGKLRAFIVAGEYFRVAGDDYEMHEIRTQRHLLGRVKGSRRGAST